MWEDDGLANNVTGVDASEDGGYHVAEYGNNNRQPNIADDDINHEHDHDQKKQRIFVNSCTNASNKSNHTFTNYIPLNGKFTVYNFKLMPKQKNVCFMNE